MSKYPAHNNSYTDMLDMEHPTSKKHPRMAAGMRAAQFAPFAALTGYGDVIDETARYVEHKVQLDENQKTKLDRMLQELIAHPDAGAVRVTWFEEDLRKEGGRYRTKSGYILQIRTDQRKMVFEDADEISLDQITDMDWE